MNKFKFKPTKKADPKCPSNGTRADNGTAALLAFRAHAGVGIDYCNVTDLIADLGHLCDREGQDFEVAVKRAVCNWRAER